MANHREGNVIYVDTSAAFTDVRNVCSIKYIGAASGTATLKGDASASGALLWQEAGTANVFDSDIEIRSDEGVYVTLTNSAVVYLYVK